MSRSYWIETWGCQMNEHDSEKLAGTLEGLGYAPATALLEADLVLLNTCAIREKAEEKVYSVLGQLVPIKRERPEMIVGVCGCVAQMSGEAIRQRAPVVDLVLGPRAAFKLPDHLARLQGARGVVDTTLYPESILVEGPAVRRQPGRVKAFVTVMEGCNKTCTYCIVPTTRGRETSRSLESLLSEVRQLASEGYREVEFLGQNVNAYRCPRTKAGLDDLLRAAGQVEGLARLRFTTSHPLHLSDAIVQAMAETPAACNHLHLPVQSGSDRVLRAMRRGYDRSKYFDRVERLRQLMPALTLSTDVIVGFPGETEDEFQETMTLVRAIEFDSIFSFLYSPRPGTVAAMLPDNVPAERKTARLMELQALQREIQWRRHRALVGTELPVLIEAASRRDPQQWAGRTTFNKLVNFFAPGHAVGELVQVRVTEAGPNSFKGELVAGSNPSAA